MIKFTRILFCYLLSYIRSINTGCMQFNANCHFTTGIKKKKRRSLGKLSFYVGNYGDCSIFLCEV
jgi:hypothetical protein